MAGPTPPPGALEEEAGVPESRRGLGGKVLGGIGWNLVSQIVVQATRIVVGVVLARLLTPHDFGLAGMALVFSGLVTIFTDVSLGAALVQRPTITERDCSTVFWTTVAIGLGWTTAGVALSGVVAGFFNQPEVARLFAFLSISFTLSAVSVTQSALLTRQLAYRTLQLREMCAALAGAAAGIALAAAGAGAWAIVAQSVAAGAASVVLLWRVSSWRPRALYSLDSLRDVGGFGIKLFASRVLAYANLNADNMLVGRFLGAGALGVYSLSYNVMFTPMLRIGLPIQQVVFPAYARMQDDPARLRAAWLRSKRLSAALLAPAFLGVAVTAPDLVSVVFGAKWKSAVPVLQLLCCAGVAHSLITLNWSVLQARGKAGTLFGINVMVTSITLAAFALGLRWGIVGVAGLFALAKWLLVVPDTWLTCRAVSLRASEALRAGSSALPISLAAAALAYVARVLLVMAGVPASVRLALVIAVGGAAYAALAALAAPSLLADVKQLRRRIGVDPVG